MENLFHLFIQTLITAAVFCVFVYFGVNRSGFTTSGKKWLYAKLIAVFIVAVAILQMIFKTQSMQSSDGWTNIIGPLVFTYLAGRFIFTRPTR